MAAARAAGIPVFVKQLGDQYHRGGVRVDLGKKGDDMAQWPAALRVREWPAADADPSLPPVLVGAGLF